MKELGANDERRKRNPVPEAMGESSGIVFGKIHSVKEIKMGLGHENLDVYRVSLEYVGWVYEFCETVNGHRSAKDQLIRASQSIPLNIAEGNGRVTDGDRRRFFEIARGSALECGAVQDILQIYGAITIEENVKRKRLLDRIVAMLTKLGQRGYSVHEGLLQSRISLASGFRDRDRVSCFSFFFRRYI